MNVSYLKKFFEVERTTFRLADKKDSFITLKIVCCWYNEIMHENLVQ